MKTIHFFAIRSAIYAPGVVVEDFTKIFQISRGDVFLEVISDEIGVNYGINL